MIKRLLVLLLVFMPFGLAAQEAINYLDNDSLKNLYVEAMKDPNIFKLNQIEMTEDEAIRIMDKFPSFAVFKDTYFVTGIPLNKKITNESADATFQISVRQRLTKSVFPFNTFAYLTYTQKSFWDIYAESSPFRDTNYNPGIGFGKVLFYKNKLVGGAFVQVKHESNGRAKEESRSWNYLSVSTKYYFNARVNIGGEIWAPFVDGEENKDLIDYKGLGTFSINYASNKHKWWLSAEINPRKGFGNINTVATVSFKISDSSNQYLFARYSNGYGESLLDYDKFTTNIRIGICIKPDFYSIY